MCGILAFLARREEPNHVSLFMNALQELQHRGYDSVGLSILDLENRQFTIHKQLKKLDASQGFEEWTPMGLRFQNVTAHTRWATHGGISWKNAHPHMDTLCGKFTMVHNGIIENYQQFQRVLRTQHIPLRSETDSEILLNYFVHRLRETHSCTAVGEWTFKEDEVRQTLLECLQKVEGTYGVVIQYNEHPHKLYCVRRGSPLIVGTSGDDYVMIASEIGAFPSSIDRILRLEKETCYVFDLLSKEGCLLLPSLSETYVRSECFEETTGPSFQYFTEKEIWEQQTLVQRVSKNYSRLRRPNLMVKLGGLESLQDQFKNLDSIAFFGCGTSFHACCILQYFFLTYGEFRSVQCFDASDFHWMYLGPYRPCLGIFLSQSGETRDLLNVLEEFNQKHLSLGITNGIDSQLSVLSHGGVYLNVGKEKGVASTKSFTAQILAGLLVLSWWLHMRSITHHFLAPLLQLDSLLSTFIPSCFEQVRHYLLPCLMPFTNIFVMGRGIDFFIAKEGALKIKELSYRHAEAYSASALKHGPFALLDENFLVLYISSLSFSNKVEETIRKDTNSIQEILARKATVVLISPQQFFDRGEGLHYLSIPSHPFSFLLSAITLQIMAYEWAVQSGYNPDFPRNLAKVVTVE